MSATIHKLRPAEDLPMDDSTELGGGDGGDHIVIRIVLGGDEEDETLEQLEPETRESGGGIWAFLAGAALGGLLG